MNYIKLFEGFKVDDKFKEDVEDIFVELKDDGYVIKYYNRNSSQTSYSEIRIYKFLRFDLEKVKEYILMFSEYMEERFNDVKFFYKVENIYQEEITLNSYEDLNGVSKELVSLSILIEI